MSRKRIDLNEKRINDHASRLARMETGMENLDKTVTREFKDLKQEIRTYFGPIKALTESNDRSILSVEKDVAWIKPWFKRGLVVAGSALTGVFGLLIKLLYQTHGGQP